MKSFVPYFDLPTCSFILTFLFCIIYSNFYMHTYIIIFLLFTFCVSLSPILLAYFPFIFFALLRSLSRRSHYDYRDPVYHSALCVFHALWNFRDAHKCVEILVTRLRIHACFRCRCLRKSRKPSELEWNSSSDISGSLDFRLNASI